MKCPNCNGLGYLSIMRPAVFGQPIQPPLECQRCTGTGVVPDPKPVPFISKMTAARRKRKGA